MRWLWELDRKGLCSVLSRESLKHWNTWGVGGVAPLVLRPRTFPVLRDICVAAKQEGVPLHLLGEGSNVLVPDEGLPGWVLLLRDDPTPPALLGTRGPLREFRVPGGVSLRRLVSWSLRRGLSGLEFALGIPGTLGGALAGNAGAQGDSIGDHVSFLEILEEGGVVRRRARSDLSFAYRTSPFQKEKTLILSAGLLLAPTEEAELRRRARAFGDLRRNQPRMCKTAGCVFRNPPGFSAGRLLDLAGCKGLVRGGARVSPRHANFIENVQDASASDILELALQCRERVANAHGVNLEFEVRLLGPTP